MAGTCTGAASVLQFFAKKKKEWLVDKGGKWVDHQWKRNNHLNATYMECVQQAKPVSSL
jgi:hypothetical protein